MTKPKEEAVLIPEINLTPAILEFAYDEEKKRLTTDLAKYENIVVTVETLAADKKLGQELAAKGKAYSVQRIEKVKEISKPIKAFEDQMKTLTSLCNDAAGVIKKQVESFEMETLKDLGVTLLETLTNMRVEANVRDEFHVKDAEKVSIKLGSLTGKGALTKGAKDSLVKIVDNESFLQQKVDYRLLQLEAESYKAGLEVPLSKKSVEAFLFGTDENYALELSEIIVVELQRQEKAKTIRAEQAAKEKPAEPVVTSDAVEPTANLRSNLVNNHVANNPDGLIASVNNEYHGDVDISQGQHFDNDHSQQMRGDEPSSDFRGDDDQYNAYAEHLAQEQASHHQEPAIQLKDGNVMCIATATFKVSVPHQVTEEMVEQKIIEMLDKAGVTSLDSMQVKKLC